MRTTARLTGASPRRAESAPVMASETSVSAKMPGIRHCSGVSSAAAKGRIAPSRNERNDAIAADHALLRRDAECAFTIALRRHRDVLAERHRHGPANYGGKTCGSDCAGTASRAGDTDDYRGSRDDAIIGPEDCSAQPVELFANTRRCRVSRVMSAPCRRVRWGWLLSCLRHTVEDAL